MEVEENTKANQCPTCGAPAQVVDLTDEIREKRKMDKGFILLHCIFCETEWTIDSQICPICGEPNKFAIKGICTKCYSANRHKKTYIVSDERDGTLNSQRNSKSVDIEKERTKKEVIDAYLTGVKVADISSRFEISTTTIYKWLKAAGATQGKKVATMQENEYTFDESQGTKICNEQEVEAKSLPSNAPVIILDVYTYQKLINDLESTKLNEAILKRLAELEFKERATRSQQILC